MVALPLWATHREIAVVVSPTVLVKESKGPPCITVHANVPVWELDLDSVRLLIRTQDGNETVIGPKTLFADQCGELVAKFDTGQVKDAVSATASGKFQTVTLILEARRLDGSLFSGACTLKVK